MKQILCFIFFIIFTLNHTRAQEVLQPIPIHKVLKADFVQKRYLSSISVPIISYGNLKSWSKKGIIWKTVKPFPSTLVISKRGLYQIEQGELKPFDKANKNDFIFKLLSNILDGSFQKGLSNFKIQQLHDSKDNYWKVNLFPKNEQMKNFLNSLRIEGNTQVLKIIIYRSNGDYDEIYFKNHEIVDNKEALTQMQRRWFDD